MLNRRGFLKGLAALLPTATLLKALPAAEVVKPALVLNKIPPATTGLRCWHGIQWTFTPNEKTSVRNVGQSDWLALLEAETKRDRWMTISPPITF